MNDDGMKSLLRAALRDGEPADGLQKRMLNSILAQDQSTEQNGEQLSYFERILFEKPLRFACMISIAISALLYAVFGNAYIGILSGILKIG